MITNNIILVDCTSNYWEFVRSLRTDERVIDGFIQSSGISKEQQEEYMKKYSSFYKIALIEEDPVGFIGSIDGDIRVCTLPSHQRKGIGKFMTKEAMKIWPESFAKVKIDNLASIKLFESCGFFKKFYILIRE
jgi:RimJ/RimL family protein N-acetyltransferase